MLIGGPPAAEEVLDSFERRHVVALVVGTASCIHAAVADVRLEGRLISIQVERVGGLDVVVAVDREVMLARALVPVWRPLPGCRL